MCQHILQLSPVETHSARPGLQWGDLNPALLFGAPVTLRADETLVTIMTEEAGMQDVTAGQVLACITEHLR